MSNNGHAPGEHRRFGLAAVLAIAMCGGFTGCDSASSSASVSGKDYAQRLLQPTNLTAAERKSYINSLNCSLVLQVKPVESLPPAATSQDAQLRRVLQQKALEKSKAGNSRTEPTGERVCECLVDTLQDRTTLLQFELAIGKDAARAQRVARANGMSQDELIRQSEEALKHKQATSVSCGKNFFGR